VLPQENGQQILKFIGRHSDFAVIPPSQTASTLWDRTDDFLAAAYVSEQGVLMTPRRTGTDGFFISMLQKKA
jgi:16S rRNA (cytosine967-C5)-methyltransferase